MNEHIADKILQEAVLRFAALPMWEQEWYRNQEAQNRLRYALPQRKESDLDYVEDRNRTF